jgi:hypothetical protein
MGSSTSSEWDRLFAKYPDVVQDLAAETRNVVREVLPEALETIDHKANLIGYGVGPGYTGAVCTIILSKSGVKLGIIGGASLPDPKKLLEGSGKVHRYVPIVKVSDARQAGVKALLRACARKKASEK